MADEIFENYCRLVSMLTTVAANQSKKAQGCQYKLYSVLTFAYFAEQKR
jgi:hypothetical protein